MPRTMVSRSSSINEGVRNANCNHSEELHAPNEELQASWYVSSRRRGDRGDERDHVVLHVERRGFQALFSGAHQRASRNGPSHDEARPWWGVSRGLSGDFMYITIPEAGTRAVHCWLTGRRSRRSRVVRAARLAECMRERVEKRVSFTSRTWNRATFLPFSSFFPRLLYVQ